METTSQFLARKRGRRPMIRQPSDGTPKKKRKLRAGTQKKWTHEEAVAILNYMKETLRLGFELEKPTAASYYAWMLHKLKLEGVNVIKLAAKVCNLKKQYNTAKEWRLSFGQAMLGTHHGSQSVREHVLRVCPEWDLLDEIFGTGNDGQLLIPPPVPNHSEPEHSISIVKNEGTESGGFFHDETESPGPWYVLPHLSRDPDPVDLVIPTADGPMEVQLPTSSSGSPFVTAQVQVDTLPFRRILPKKKLKNKVAGQEQEHPDPEPEKDRSQAEAELELERERLTLLDKHRSAEFRLKERELESNEKLRILELEKDERVAKFKIEQDMKLQLELAKMKYQRLPQSQI